MLTLYTDEKYRIAPNKMNGWEIQQANGKGKWIPISWPHTLSGALQGLVRMNLCSDEIQTLADALKEIDRVSEAITEALTPELKSLLKRCN